MKVIKSNPWGTGIHSPYVYHLVAKVIFGKKSAFREDFSCCRQTGFGVAERIGWLFSLIDDFQPDTLILAGEENRFDPSRCDLFNRFRFRQIYSDQLNWLGNEKEFVIFDGLNCTLFDIPGYAVPAIWVLWDLHELEQSLLFTKLRNSQKVSLTIEVNRMGIVIFNRNFRKQDYQVRRWFLF